MPLFSALRRGKKSIGYDTQGGVRNQPLSRQTFTRKIQSGANGLSICTNWLILIS